MWFIGYVLGHELLSNFWHFMQVGCGADELIDLLMRCCLDSGDVIVDCPPTFTMYAFDAAVNDARVVTVPRLAGFKIDVEGEFPPMQMSCLYATISTCPKVKL